MERRKSSSDNIRQKRLRRKKFILAVFNLLKRLWEWLHKVITFKKGIIVFCIWYFVDYVEYLKEHYTGMGIPFPSNVAITILTLILGELGLSALTSVKNKKYEMLENIEDIGPEDENYG